MTEQVAQSGNQGQIFCSHCGTANKIGSFACDRCGERVYRPDPDQPSPLGLAACPKCSAANEAHARYCVNCGHSMDSAVRLSPAGAQVARDAARVEPVLRPRQRQPVPPARTRAGRPRADLRREAPQRQPQPAARPQSDGTIGSNDSGTRDAQLPASLKRWNWGAFLAGPVWGVGNGVWVSLIAFLPLILQPLSPQLRFGIYLLTVAYLGLRGNELAWRARKWESIEKFRQVQQQWVVWGVITATIIAFFVAPFLMNSASE